MDNDAFSTRCRWRKTKPSIPHYIPSFKKTTKVHKENYRFLFNTSRQQHDRIRTNAKRWNGLWGVVYRADEKSSSVRRMALKLKWGVPGCELERGEER